MSLFTMLAFPCELLSPSEKIKSASAVYGRYSFSIISSLEKESLLQEVRQSVIAKMRSKSFDFEKTIGHHP